MRILVAEDDAVCQAVLEQKLKRWGHDVIVARDGLAAWQVLQRDDAPKLAIIDWIMPGMSGPAVCRHTRDLVRQEPTYLILLTVKDRKEDVVVGLDSGADDFIAKPYDEQELRSRIRVGQRMIALQSALAERVRKLEAALAEVTKLHGLLPICSYCKKVRDDKDYWQEVDTYVAAHSDIHFSHGICPTCWGEVVEPEMAKAGIPPSVIT
jgi:DNA-binding response OmpR family regulator